MRHPSSPLAAHHSSFVSTCCHVRSFSWRARDERATRAWRVATHAHAAILKSHIDEKEHEPPKNYHQKHPSFLIYGGGECQMEYAHYVCAKTRVFLITRARRYTTARVGPGSDTHTHVSRTFAIATITLTLTEHSHAHRSLAA